MSNGNFKSLEDLVNQANLRTSLDTEGAIESLESFAEQASFERRSTRFYDDTDGLAGGSNYRLGKPVDKSGLVIQFYHVPTVKKDDINYSRATFKAFLTTFNDKFKTNWNPKETFGRMDAVQTFKNTQRTINISFDVPSVSEEDALQNFHELEKLIMMQYPVYETKFFSSEPSQQTQSSKSVAENVENKAQDDVTAAVSNTKSGRFISSPPLIYLKFMNWLTNVGNDNTNDFSDCLVVAIDGVDFTPDLEQGVFKKQGQLIPKLFSVSINATVIHTGEVGWPSSNAFGQNKNSFPYKNKK